MISSKVLVILNVHPFFFIFPLASLLMLLLFFTKFDLHLCDCLFNFLIYIIVFLFSEFVLVKILFTLRVMI